GVKTVEEAMDLALKENRQYLEWASGKKTRKTSDKKPIRTEFIPDWFNEEESSTPKQETNKDVAAKKRALEERLKKYKK
ncbi:MAG TPA: Replication initiation and membrane attachment protein, partial [Pseudoneobacillus sp.]|nr:Replication initiation and membrane attachment protein [Pseudoneobacillus sp.]